MQKFEEPVQNLRGDTIALAPMLVFLAGTETPAAIYFDAAGQNPIADPRTDRSGVFAFYAANGRYDVYVLVNGVRLGHKMDLLMYDPADAGGDLAALSESVQVLTDAAETTSEALDILRTHANSFVSIKDAPFNASGDGVADDTAAMDQYLAFCAANDRDAFLPDGAYLIGHLAAIALPTGKLTIRGSSRDRCTIKVASSAYTGNTAPILAITGAGDVAFRDVTIDQNLIGLTYPPGHSYADNARASTWGGGSWLFDIGTTGKVEFDNCGWLNVFRGALVKGAKSNLFCRNRSDSMASLGQTIMASEDCKAVTYHRNSLPARNWKDNPGITGAAALFGIACDNVQISNNFMIGHQLVFHGTAATDGGYGHRIQVTGNIVDTPPADTAFYRWQEAVVANNIVRRSGDMGIAVSDCSYVSVTGNTISGTHIGGIGLTNCKGGVVSGNIIRDIAQVYPEILTIAGRYGSNAGTFMSGIVTDYQAGGGQSKGLSITGNSLYFDNLPPVSDANGPVRSKVFGILFDTSANLSAQNTGVVTGNFLYQDAVNLPNFNVMVPTHRFYLAGASRVGTPQLFETFVNGANSFRLLRDYGDGNIVFIDRLVGTIGAAVAFVGQKSGATLVSSNPLPQLTFLNCIAANNIDGTL